MKVAAFVAAAALCVSCGGPRSQLNTDSGQCFRALPAARDAVGRKGELVGIHLVSSGALARAFPGAPASAGHRVCTVAFKDDYEPGDVPQATTMRSGRYALVILDPKNFRPLATLVLDSLPKGFGHGL